MSLKNQTVLVTGAGGFLGGALARQLAAEGVNVRALIRNRAKAGYITDVPGITLVDGDLENELSLKKAVEGCAIVFHVAAALGGSPDLQARINIEGTRLLATAAAHAGVKRFVHVSSIAIYGFTDLPDLITEDTPPSASEFTYTVTKRAAEGVLKLVAAQTGMAYSIIRPGMIYGAGSTNWTLALFKHAKRAPVLFPGEGDGSAHPIYIDDVVDMILRMATDDRALGQVFNCTPDPAPTWREWLLGYARLAGGHQQWRAIPPFLAHMGAGLGMMFAPAGSGRRDLPEILEMFLSRVTFSTAKGRELLGWEQKISLAEGIERCIPYLRAQNLL